MYDYSIHTSEGGLVPTSDLRCMNAKRRMMVGDVSLSEVADAPTNWYDYTLPQKMFSKVVNNALYREP